MNTPLKFKDIKWLKLHNESWQFEHLSKWSTESTIIFVSDEEESLPEKEMIQESRMS